MPISSPALDAIGRHYIREDVLQQSTAAVVSDRLRTEVPMKPKCLILVAGITAALSCSALGQQDEKLGKLSFPTSCDPKVQAEFERGVAMIHSYWFLIARRTFEGVLRQDPTCAMAYWGIALDLLNNSLAVVPPRADAEAAWAALEKAREIGAKTQRERDWIEALSAYYRDHERTPVNARLVAYNNAMEKLTQRYPDDYEAKVFYALTLQASASPAEPLPPYNIDISK